MGIELIVVTLNLIVLVFAYGVLNPAFSRRDLIKILTHDLIALSISLMVVGFHFANKQLSFNLLMVDVGWFWFTLLTFLALKTPLFFWYVRRWNIMLSIHLKP
ncbi:hypothetical protein PCIT_a1350 [Pseudoalteromonas citrea]|uniref:Uncharacterized protein n=2 Tax=Pseudoalteromonas citrea TaxID=43655 RepID=A0AAD4FTP5_9GAMM|nr:hypothetical protein [Pseudoalteromonas citrea]KAF7775212.1 hypothetical protein PCIT_a1350 [Pseudoalteromonas citrea]